MDKKLIEAILEQALGSQAQKQVDAICLDQYMHKHEANTTLLAADTLGACKHWLRGKIGFTVDLIWNLPEVQSELSPLCLIAATRIIARDS